MHLLASNAIDVKEAFFSINRFIVEKFSKSTIDDMYIHIVSGLCSILSSRKDKKIMEKVNLKLPRYFYDIFLFIEPESNVNSKEES